MVDVAIVSDTHIPSRADRIPDWVVERVEAADHVIHVGDFDSPEAYETVVDLAGGGEGSDASRTSSDRGSDGNLTAVAGNMDPASLDLPEVATVEVSGTTFVVTHGTAPSVEEYEETVAEAVSEELDGPGIAVAGHTHAVVNGDIEGIRFLNPGSATGADPAEAETMIVVEIIEGDVNVETYVDDERVENPDEYPEK